MIVPINIRLRTTTTTIDDEGRMAAGLASALDTVDEGIAWRMKREQDSGDT